MSRRPGELLKWTEPDRDGPRIDRLVAALAALDGRADDAAVWPAALWNLIEKEGAARWSLPKWLGDSCPRPLLVQRYAQLATGSLTAVFILSQHDAAVRRLCRGRGAAGTVTAAHWLSEISAGRAFATVGISHLTTSRRLGRHRGRNLARLFPVRRRHPLGHGGPARSSW